MIMLSFVILMFAGRYSKNREESSSPDRTLGGEMLASRLACENVQVPIR